MSVDYLLVRLAENWLLPPGGLLLLAVLAFFLLAISRKVIAFTLMASALGLIYLSSIPATTDWLNQRLSPPEPYNTKNSKPQAIVVLGASRYRDAPEYGGDSLFGFGLERVRYAAHLQKKTGLPILVSGGSPTGETTSESEVMAEVLENEFRASVKWRESESRTTWENALYSAKILEEAGIETIALVTHAWHMKRAQSVFERQGVTVFPAATLYYRKSPLSSGWLKWVPNSGAQYRNSYAFHELAGLLWYKIKYFKN